MKSKFNLIAVLVCLFGVTSMAQTTYSTSVNASGGQNYTVSVSITPTSIVPVQSTCDWGYNYDVSYNYDVQIIGSNAPSLYTIAGYLSCGSNQEIYFDLPNNGGSGSNVTQGNPWTSNSDCATATIESLECNTIDIQIEGVGIPNQTITLESTTGGDADGSEWDTNGNSCDTSAFIGTVNQSDLRFRTNNIERMRLTEDGKFGIGVTNPLENLDLQGNFKLSGDAIFSDYADANDTLGKVLFLDQDGRTTPKSFDQLKNLFYAAPIGDKPASLCDIGILQQNPTWSNGPNKLYSLCPDVNVGIGTSQPEFSLHTIGTGYFSGGVRLGTINNPSLPAFIEGKYPVKSSKPWIRFTVKESDGNDNTAFLVENDGGLFCTSVRVRLREDIPVPDYVFKKDYPLMPLTQLKEFVNTNNHLPNIPSEKEVKENGLSIEEMQLKLLEKVEELTLYVIELDEENKRLTEKVKELENQ